MGSTPAPSARSEYVQARLDAILARAGTPPPPVEAVEQSPTVLAARRRAGAPLLEQGLGEPRRRHSDEPRRREPDEPRRRQPDEPRRRQPDEGGLVGAAAAPAAPDRAVTLRVPQLSRRHLGVLAAVLALAVAFSAFLLLRARADSQPVALAASATAVVPTPAAPAGPGSATPTGSPEPVLLVHVLGAVAEPGVVELPAGSRVVDALEAAGGLTEQARPGELNLAQVLTDGQQVLVSDDDAASTVRGADGAAGGPAAPGGEPAGPASQLDLNTATLAQLEELPGVGPVTAQKILDRRAEGRFTRVEELQEVPGIGPKTYAEVAPHVRV
ncbi:hypothetical protein GC722_16350 [Auraticoccus sp. F435]|uniref:Helix-hairpin-helix DNA-binding motif class 1 domain-containing protein n=1 Tax=Auraticoccus cholistanensis TaxID=2656650 RepID=A0A6A9V1T8_9ACTN|nr:helix-hairpin-helix domain-containing protein [Auraticoccus cholistanensis]MVA77576.1 hypothetical protein [Auraticoccus cholistanensis]